MRVHTLFQYVKNAWKRQHTGSTPVYTVIGEEPFVYRKSRRQCLLDTIFRLSNVYGYYADVAVAVPLVLKLWVITLPHTNTIYALA